MRRPVDQPIRRAWLRRAVIGFGAVYLSLAASEANAGGSAVVDFESVPVGTRYGGSAPVPDNPGDIVLTQNGIDMSVEQFHLGAFTGFNFAEVGGAFDGFFPTTPLELNNINVRFHFDNVGFAVSEVRLEYQEFGGSDNFAVNGGTLFELDTLTSIPVNVATGVTASVLGGEIRLLGNIDSFEIGGQELAIDNVVAVPEPATGLLVLAGAAGVVLRRRRGCDQLGVA